MLAKARDLMNRQFHTLKPEMTMLEAFERFSLASEREKQSVVIGMAVVDDHGDLVGMLSMYDILPLIRPSRPRQWDEMDEVEVARLIDTSCAYVKSIRVGDIMTGNVITVAPDTHAMEILDVMIRRHIRRMPVIEGGKIIGMLYISSVFKYFGERVKACATISVGERPQ
jgi:CBS domain-containing protein